MARKDSMARQDETIPSELVSALHAALKDLDCPPEHYKKMLKGVIFCLFFKYSRADWPVTVFHARKILYYGYYFWRLNEQEKAKFLINLRKFVQEEILTEQFKKTGEWGNLVEVGHPCCDDDFEDKGLWGIWDDIITPPRCKTYTRCIDELKI